MKKKVLIITAASVIALNAQYASALTWVPQVGLQYKNLNFEQTLKGGDEGDLNGDFSANMPMLSASITGVHKKFYASIKYEAALSSQSTNSDVPFTEADSDISRDDLSVTVGYKVWKNLNLFLGYLSGETEIEPEPTDDNLSGEHDFVGLGQYRQNYEESGLYFGLSYGWRIKEAGTISASLAYANMDGVYKDNYAAVPDQNFKYEGDSTGLSYGITWSSPINETFGYYLDLRQQSYSMDADDANGNFPGSSAETDETMTSFTAGTQFYF